jgi:hypothetical protein
MFRRKGVFFIPINLGGWLVFAVAVCYAVYNGWALNNKAHSVSDFLMNLVFSLLIICGIYSLIAWLTLTKNP